MSYQLIVALKDGDGHIVAQQPYNEFQYEKRSKDILIRLRGDSLISMLQNEGYISYDNKENKLVLKYILSSLNDTISINVSTMRLLGKIAEIVLVRHCAEDKDVNKKLFQIARRKNAWSKTSDKFKAIGTGLKTTQQYYPERYNPSDTQRDIIWVDENGRPALMEGSTSMSGIIAGLQVKVSLDGMKYILPDLVRCRYEVPLVYFPIANDYEKILTILEREARTAMLDPDTGDYRPFRPGKDFVDIRAYDYDAYEEVKDYYPLINDLITERIKPYELVDIASQLNNPVLKNTLMLNALQYSNSDPVVLH